MIIEENRQLYQCDGWLYCKADVKKFRKFMYYSGGLCSIRTTGRIFSARAVKSKIRQDDGCNYIQRRRNILVNTGFIRLFFTNGRNDFINGYISLALSVFSWNCVAFQASLRPSARPLWCHYFVSLALHRIITNKVYILQIYFKQTRNQQGTDLSVTLCLVVGELPDTWRYPNWISNIWRWFRSRGVIVVTGVAYKGWQEGVHLPFPSPWVKGVEWAYIIAL
jgi:hypothetical protein